MTNDYCFHSRDAVHADNQATCDDAKLTAVGIRASQKNPPKTSRSSHVAGAQDDEDTLAAPQSADSGGAPGNTVAGDHEIGGSVHCERLAGAGAMTRTGLLNVRTNASSCLELGTSKCLCAGCLSSSSPNVRAAVIAVV